MSRALPRLALGCGIALGACGAAAVEAANEPLFYEVSTGLRYTDNVYLLPANGESGTAGTVGLLLRGRQESGPLQYDANVDLDYLDYLTGHVPNEFLGQLSGTARYSLLPQALSWELDEHFGPIVTDYFLPPSPLNVQNVNVVNTGPDLRVRLADSWSVLLSGRFGLDTWQTSPLDDKRLSAQASLQHELSTVSTVGLGASRQTVRYDSTLEQPLDFDVNSFFLSYSTRTARTTLRAQLGYSQTTGGTAQASGVTGNLTLNHRVTSRTTVSLNVGRAVETAASGALGTTEIPSPTLPTGNALLTGGPVIADTLGADWRTQWTRTTLEFSGSIEKDTSSGTLSQSRRFANLNATATRRLTSRIDASLLAAWDRYDLTGNGPGRETDTSIGVRAAYRFTGKLLGSIDLSRTDRSSNDNGSFRADVVWLRLGYAPRGVRLPYH